MKHSLAVLLRTTALAGSIGGFGLSLPAQAQSPPTDLGTLNFDTYANAISADGSVIVGDGKNPSTGGTEAFKYSGTTMTFLGLPAGTYTSYAGAVSSDGSVIVGGNYDGTDWRAFTYYGGVMYSLIGGTYTQARGVSADGSVVVGTSKSAGLNEAVKWTGTGGTAAMTGLGFLTGGTYSNASGVSGDGTVTVGSSEYTIGVQHAVKWVGTVITDLGTLTGGTNSYARAVSADGLVIVGTEV